jgi:hypothetical protein
MRSLLEHKTNVVKAGGLTGVPFGRLLLHDWSKFSPAEFGRYARWHHGDPELRDKREWAAAWQHHLHHNPHHPEFWLLAWHGNPDFYAVDGVGERVADNIIVLPMPETYVREMVADWLAASRTYTGKWDIALWLNEHGPKMRLHDRTVGELWGVMCEIGYMATDNCNWSWAAGQRFRDWANRN